VTIDICTKTGRRIRSLRSAKGMSQESLAGLANLGRINLSRIENGKAEPGLRTLGNIARALDISLSELLEGIR